MRFSGALACTAFVFALLTGPGADARPWGWGGQPAAPSELTVQPMSNSVLTLAWRDNSKNETHFHIEQLVDGVFEEVKTVSRGSTSTEIIGLDPDTSYTFRVRASNKIGYSDPSDPVSTMTDRPPGAPPKTPFYAYYYLWWKLHHWESKLGPNYPWGEPWPMPGEVSRSTECQARANFPGSRLVDLPEAGPYDSTKPDIYPVHVRQAAQAGLTGFMVGWHGPGTRDQTVTSEGKNRRLHHMVTAVRDYNATHTIPFTYIIDYQVFQNVRSSTFVSNDIEYLLSMYGDDPAWGEMDGRKVFRWSNTKNYPTSILRAVYERYSDRLFIIGEERPYTWNSTRAKYLEGSGRYWSVQDPYRNPRSFEKNKEFAEQIHRDGRLWFAPLIPGYNDELNERYYGDPVETDDCIARKGTETMRRVFEGNRESNPDGWFIISWNEWVEHTYIEPSKRYGSTALDEVARIIEEVRQSE